MQGTEHSAALLGVYFKHSSVCLTVPISLLHGKLPGPECSEAIQAQTPQNKDTTQKLIED